MSAQTYAPSEIADREYDVTSFRADCIAYVDGNPVDIRGREFAIGERNVWGNTITAIRFYTGFAGCPARYYVTTQRADGFTQTSCDNA